MTQERRTRKVYEKLSVTERARLVLEAYKEDRPVDVLLNWTTPEEQWQDLSERVRQMVALNTNVALLLASWEARMRLLETQWGWFLTLRQWGTTARETALYLLAHELDENDHPHERLQSYVRRAPLRQAMGAFPHDGEARNEADIHATELAQHLGEGITNLWQDICASEAVISEVARNFVGDDPLEPSLRAGLDRLRETLERLAEQVPDVDEPQLLDEPTASLTEDTRLLLLRELG